MFSFQDDEIYFAALGRKEKPEKSEFVISDYVKWVALIDMLVKQERERESEEHCTASFSSLQLIRLRC